MTTTFNWVCSLGGPLIVAPSEIARYWRGGKGLSPSEGDDYARAGGINDYLGTLKVGPGEAVIFGDEPMQTAFIPNVEGGIFVRWFYAESEGDVSRAIESVPASVWKPTPHRIEVSREGLLLFDSVLPGNTLPLPRNEINNDLWIHIKLPEGTYSFDTADYEADESTRLILHRLRRHRSDHV